MVLTSSLFNCLILGREGEGELLIREWNNLENVQNIRYSRKTKQTKKTK